jgi:hypothetical protein
VHAEAGFCSQYELGYLNRIIEVFVRSQTQWPDFAKAANLTATRDRAAAARALNLQTRS